MCWCCRARQEDDPAWEADHVAGADSKKGGDDAGVRNIKSWKAVQGMRVNGDNMTLAEGIQVPLAVRAGGCTTLFAVYAVSSSAVDTPRPY